MIAENEKDQAERVSITIPTKMKDRAYDRAEELNFVSSFTGDVNFSAYIRYCIKKDLEEAENEN